jgi:hypothetical protein
MVAESVVKSYKQTGLGKSVPHVAAEDDVPGRDIPIKTPRELILYVVNVENQLRLTQLVLGGVLGFYLGHLLGGWEFGVLLALGGLAVAAVRSSLLGAWMGFIGGIMLVPLFAPAFDDTWSGSRLLIGAVGALLGSFLGDFWRRVAKPERPPAGAEEADAGAKPG